MPRLPWLSWSQTPSTRRRRRESKCTAPNDTEGLVPAAELAGEVNCVRKLAAQLAAESLHPLPRRADPAPPARRFPLGLRRSWRSATRWWPSRSTPPTAPSQARSFLSCGHRFATERWGPIRIRTCSPYTARCNRMLFAIDGQPSTELICTTERNSTTLPADSSSVRKARIARSPLRQASFGAATAPC